MTFRNEINLECAHATWYTKPYPKPGERVWCVRCTEYRTVVPTVSLIAEIIIEIINRPKERT